MTEEPNVSQSPIVFSETHAMLTELRDKHKGLKINGVEDKAGLKAVGAARLELKRHRTTIENTRKKLKADALEYGRRVDNAAKELVAIIEPTERELEAEENRIAAEVEKLRREEAERQAVELNRRAAICVELGQAIDLKLLQSMTKDEFNAFCAEAGKQKAEREAAEKAERKRLADERAKLEQEKRDLEAQRAAMQQAAPIPQTQMEFPPAAQPGKAFISQPLQTTAPTPMLEPAPGSKVYLASATQGPRTCPTCGQPVPGDRELEW